MRSNISPLLLCGSILTVLSRGEQTFSNTGVLSGWTRTVLEHQGTIDEVTNVFYEGSPSDGSSPTALKMTQTYDASYSGRYHSEVSTSSAYALGDDGFYGFAFRLSSEWDFASGGSFNLAQFIADFADLGCDETYMPSTMVWLEGDQLSTRVKHGDVCPADSQVTDSWDGVATVSAGVWHTVVLQARWRSDDSGFFKMWFDGDKVVEEYDRPTTVSDGRGFEFRVGLYANGWYDSGFPEGSQGFRQVWMDQVGFGSEFADADPAQW